MGALQRVIAKRIKSAATINVFPDQVVSIDSVRQILVVLPVKNVVTMNASLVQAVSAMTVLLIPNAPAGRVVVAILAFPVQTASAKAASMITIVRKGDRRGGEGRVAVTAFAKMAPCVWGLLVPLTLFAEKRKDVVTEYASTRKIVITLPPASLLVQ